MGVQEEKAQFYQQWLSDKRLLKRIDRATIVIPIVSVAILFWLLIARETWGPSLIALSLYNIFTRLSMMIAYRAFLYPGFFRALLKGDEPKREAAILLLDEHRKEILYEIRRERFEPTADEALNAISIDEICGWEEVAAISARRRFMVRWFYLWIAVSAVVAWLVIRAS